MAGTGATGQPKPHTQRPDALLRAPAHADRLPKGVTSSLPGKENIIGLISQVRERHRENGYCKGMGLGGGAGMSTQVDALRCSLRQTPPRASPEGFSDFQLPKHTANNRRSL